jgi:hypothetical protein
MIIFNTISYITYEDQKKRAYCSRGYSKYLSPSLSPSPSQLYNEETKQCRHTSTYGHLQAY